MKLTATHGIIAMKGSGKTYRAMATAEAMLDAGGQIVAIDPTGAWWGLRLAPDGKRVAYPQLLVLGANGSLPLSDNMGEAVAHLVVDKRLSVVLDLSAMSKAGMRRFVAAFLLELYRINPMRPVHTFVDEADLFAPERALGEVAHCMGAMSDYFRRGRRKGLGGTIITQRVQAVSKDVLWQCEAMTILRLKGTHDIAAIKDWLDSNGYEARAIAEALPKLNKGDRYYCGEEAAVMTPRGADRRKTYDSSRTPEPGDDQVAPPALDDAAIEAIKGQLGEVVAEIEANDPTKLKTEVAKLRKQLAAMPASPAMPDQTALDAEFEKGWALCCTEVNPRLDGLVEALTMRVGELKEIINGKTRAPARGPNVSYKAGLAPPRSNPSTLEPVAGRRAAASPRESSVPAEFPTGKLGEIAMLGLFDYCPEMSDPEVGEDDACAGCAGNPWPVHSECRAVRGPRLDWVIVGGESGPGARPCDVAWIRSIVDKCKAAGVPCFVKQVGSDPRDEVNGAVAVGYGPVKDRKGGDPSEWPTDLRVRQFPVLSPVEGPQLQREDAKDREVAKNSGVTRA